MKDIKENTFKMRKKVSSCKNLMIAFLKSQMRLKSIVEMVAMEALINIV